MTNDDDSQNPTVENMDAAPSTVDNNGDVDAAMNKYRIEQLELQLKELKESAEQLNLKQIKQMILYLGLPVAVVTGVFGLALWQVIETSAGNRAAQEVLEIAEDIEQLESRSAEMARDAETRFGDLREIAGRADEAARAVRTRADDARTQAAEAERLLKQLRTELETVPALQAALEDTGSIANALSTNPTFRDRVAGEILKSLSGAVVAFDLEAGCPIGWQSFDAAASRVIVGVGQGAIDRPGDTDLLLTNRNNRDFGGEEAVKLSLDQMPTHSHSVLDSGHVHGALWADGRSGQDFGWDDDRGTRGSVETGKAVTGITLATSGEGRSHNNMPPYIALYFCKKD